MDQAENRLVWHTCLRSLITVMQLPFIANALQILHGATLLLIEQHPIIYQFAAYELTMQAL